MSRNVPKVAHFVSIEPLMAHVLLMRYIQNALCKTDQPPCQLGRPQKLNNRVDTDTYIIVCIGFKMKLIKHIILMYIQLWTLWPAQCIAVLMNSLDYCWWSACVCGPNPPHRVGIWCVGVICTLNKIWTPPLWVWFLLTQRYNNCSEIHHGCRVWAVESSVLLAQCANAIN